MRVYLVDQIAFVVGRALRARLAICVLAVCSSALSPAQTPLPDDFSIFPPSSDVGQAAAAFSGAWLGAWGGEVPTALVVERVRSKGTARVVYSWGDSPVHQFEADWCRQKARVSEGKLQFSLDNGAKLDFTLAPSGGLLGRYQLPGQPPSFAVLHRIPVTNTAAILEAAKMPRVAWEEVRIPVQSRVGRTKDKTFALQTTIYRQASAGKHPVVIFNHGSTGPGIVPANAVFREQSEANFFHSLGYVVVVPMRKGRGASEGPNVEEEFFLASDAQLDSAIEDLDAVVGYVRHHMDAGKLVVAGVSRGGLLSVAYAGRYPTNVAGVINFSGGWFGEWVPAADFNFEAFGKAGHDAKVPMLWLYADQDSFYSLKYAEREFAKFRDAGGRGELLEVRDIAGDGHALYLWVDRWRDKATSYLSGL